MKNTISKYLIEDIQKVLINVEERNPVKVRDFTPSILVEYGVKDLPIYENASHVRKNILSRKEARKIGLSINSREHYHGLGIGLYLSVIKSIDDPRVIFRNKNNKDFFIVTNVKDNKGNSLVVPIEIETFTRINKMKIHVNRIKTVYGYDKKCPDLNLYIKKKMRDGMFIKIYEKRRPGYGNITVARSSCKNNIP